MAKISLTYIGTPDDETKSVAIGGETFEKGKAVSVDDSNPTFKKLATNPTFKKG